MPAAPDRLTWEETWGRMAKTMALRSACGQKQVGAVVVTADNVVAATGYNGQPAGMATGCGECPRRLGGARSHCTAVHAEVNALLRSGRSERDGGTIYVTGTPCWQCALAIANSGLARVVRVDPNLGPGRTDAVAVCELLEKCGVTEAVMLTSPGAGAPAPGQPRPRPTAPAVFMPKPWPPRWSPWAG